MRRHEMRKKRINTKKKVEKKALKMSINITIARKLKSLEENYPWIIFFLLFQRLFPLALTLFSMLNEGENFLFSLSYSLLNGVHFAASSKQKFSHFFSFTVCKEFFQFDEI